MDALYTASSAKTRGAMGMGSKLTVIYVDDEIDLLQVFIQTLGRNGIEVKGFADPHLGLTEALARPPDVMIVDYRLPGMTGDQLVQKLPPGITTALVTGDLNVNLKAPFTRIFSKPYELLEIRQFLETCRAYKNTLED
jgi:DNA-binding NtrC family response regulator